VIVAAPAILRGQAAVRLARPELGQCQFELSACGKPWS
jgi:hypothetical protein